MGVILPPVVVARHTHVKAAVRTGYREAFGSTDEYPAPLGVLVDMHRVEVIPRRVWFSNDFAVLDATRFTPRRP